MKSKQRRNIRRQGKKNSSGTPSPCSSIESTVFSLSLLRSWVKRLQLSIQNITECRKDLSFPYDLWPRVSPHPRVSFLLCMCMLYVIWTCLRIPVEREHASPFSCGNTSRPSVVLPSASQPLLFSSFFQLLFRSLSLLLVVTFVYRVVVEWMTEDETKSSSLLTPIDESSTSRHTTPAHMLHTSENRTNEIESYRMPNHPKDPREEEERLSSGLPPTNAITKRSGTAVSSSTSFSSTSSAFGFSTPSDAQVELLADNAVHFIFAVWRKFFLFHEDYPLRPVACQLEAYTEKYRSENVGMTPPALLMCRWKRALILFGIPVVGVVAQYLSPSFLLLLVGAAVTLSFFCTLRQKEMKK